MNFSVSVRITPSFARKRQQVKQRSEQLLALQVELSAQQAAQQLGNFARQQLALPGDRIDQAIILKYQGRQSAEVIASGEPIGLEEYPHRVTQAGIDVVVNPGQVATLPRAKKTRGVIVGLKNGRYQRLYGPGVDQIARDSFLIIAQNLENSR